MAKFFLIIIQLFFLSCSTDEDTSRNNEILPERYIVYNNFPSKYVIPRNIEIWLPAGYDKMHSLPVLYMFDGQNIFHGRKSWMENKYNHGWQVDLTLDSLNRLGTIPKIIVVGIFNTGLRRYSEYIPNQPREQVTEQLKFADDWVKKSINASGGIKSDSLLMFIVKELKPYIDKNYKTKKDKEHTLLAGSSMGGIISIYAICEYPDIFGKAACLSTHWSSLGGVFIEYLENNLPDSYSHKIYFDYGTEGLDKFYEPYQSKVDSIMISSGFEKNLNWLTKKFDGEDHNEDFWRKRFHYAMEFLFIKN